MLAGVVNVFVESVRKNSGTRDLWLSRELTWAMRCTHKQGGGSSNMAPLCF